MQHKEIIGENVYDKINNIIDECKLKYKKIPEDMGDEEKRELEKANYKVMYKSLENLAFALKDCIFSSFTDNKEGILLQIQDRIEGKTCRKEEKNYFKRFKNGTIKIHTGTQDKYGGNYLVTELFFTGNGKYQLRLNFNHLDCQNIFIGYDEPWQEENNPLDAYRTSGINDRGNPFVEGHNIPNKPGYPKELDIRGGLNPDNFEEWIKKSGLVEHFLKKITGLEQTNVVCDEKDVIEEEVKSIIKK